MDLLFSLHFVNKNNVVFHWLKNKRRWKLFLAHGWEYGFECEGSSGHMVIRVQLFLLPSIIAWLVFHLRIFYKSFFLVLALFFFLLRWQTKVHIQDLVLLKGAWHGSKLCVRIYFHHYFGSSLFYRFSFQKAKRFGFQFTRIEFLTLCKFWELFLFKFRPMI